MGLTWKAGLHLQKYVTLLKNVDHGSHLQKCVTLGRMGHSHKSGPNLENSPHLEN